MSLNKKQTVVLDMLFLGTGVDAALEDQKISRVIFREWMKTKQWQKAFQERVDDAKLEAQTIIASHVVIAALQLIGLMGSKSETVKRQACLDILGTKSLVEAPEEVIEEPKKKSKMSDKEAEAILKMIAESKGT